MRMLIVLLWLVALPSVAVAQEAPTCTADERLVIDGSGQRCVAKTQEQIDQDAALQQRLPKHKAARDAEVAREADINSAADVIALYDKLKTANAADIDTWVNNNVTDLASAKKTLATIIKILALQARQGI